MTIGEDDTNRTAAPKDRVLAAHHNISEATRELTSASGLVELIGRLREFRALLVPHFMDEEATDGFFDLIRARAARHLGRVSQLEAEHTALLGELDRLAERARACLDGPVAEILRGADGLARRLHEHEAAESALLIDALYVDVGEED